MSFKQNVIANYASQLYAAAVGILIVPLYIRIMGAEAYGLVAFFALLQSFFLLLDVGLTPTVSREAARYRGGATSARELLQLIRALEGMFWLFGVAAAFMIWLWADDIAQRWLQAMQLTTNEVRHAIEIMGAIAGLRWISGLYRGVITGFERLAWLAAFNSAMATCRFLVVLPLLMFVSATPQAFFTFQLVIALVEVMALVGMAHRLLPSSHGRVAWQWAPLQRTLGFSSTLAVTSLIWLATTQLDKLLLSKLLPLAEFGYFSMAVLVASGVTIISSPISSAILPRLANRAAAQDYSGLHHTYRQATQLVAATVIPVAGLMAAYAEPLLWLWTNDARMSAQAAPIVSLYAAGNGLMALGAFAYYLQYAHGKLRLHLLGNVLFICVLIPAVWWATHHHGPLGAGWAWLLSNAAYLMLWVPLVHRRLAPGLHITWLMQDIGRSVVATVLSIAASGLLTWPTNRWSLVAMISSLGIFTFAINILAQPSVRRAFLNYIRNLSKVHS